MLDNLKKKVAALQKFSFQDELLKAVTDNKDKIANLQRKQLDAGKDANNHALTLEGGGYAPFTLIMKFRKNQPLYVTWKDTGEMHNSIRAMITGQKFSLTSDNFKFHKMLERSGEDAVGLNFDSRKEFIETVTRPAVLKAYDEKVRKV
jgi:hypothetical protein